VSESERQCKKCGTKLHSIGQETCEQIDYKPSSLFVNLHIQKKYACGGCHETVVIAEKPAQPIEKGLPGPGLLAHVLVSKYADHLPLNRQEKIFKRDEVDIPRSTLCDWVRQTVEILQPVYDQMKKDVLRSKAIHNDDTPVPVLDQAREHTREGRLWATVGDKDHPHIVYDYSPDRKKEHPKEFLGDYRGYLQADAYSGYDHIFATGQVIELGCWAHARRYFFEAKDTDSERSLLALAYVQQLYQVEDEAKDLTPDERKKMRQERSSPVLESFKRWLDREGMSVLPQSPLGKAFHYAQAQWIALTRYVADGDLDIDNNIAERALRGVAVGRKNWLFAGSDEGGKRAAVVYTLVESCKRIDVDPFEYLRDVIDRIATYPMNRIDELTPIGWKSKREQPNTS
jgi:transposase